MRTKTYYMGENCVFVVIANFNGVSKWVYAMHLLSTEFKLIIMSYKIQNVYCASGAQRVLLHVTWF